MKNNETGLLVPAKNSAALAETINDLLGNADKRKMFGKNARKNIRESFGINIVVSKLVQFFNNL